MAPTQIFLYSSVFAALAGIAAMLRSEKKLTVVGIISSLMNSGLLGLGISLLWYNKFSENLYFLVGVCVMAGLGGMTTVDLALKIFQKNALKIAGEKANETN